MQYFHDAVLIWTGFPLQWKALDVDVRNLIRNINQGSTECFCKNCKRVLDPNGTSQYCSQDCASQFCRCGEKFEIKMVADGDRWERMQKQLGPYGPMKDLAMMLPYKSFIESCPTRIDLGDHFQELSDKRAADKCCNPLEGVIGMLGRPWCKRCASKFAELNQIGRYIDRIKSGEVNWGHCEEAARRLKTLTEMKIPTKEQKFCGSCEARSVKNPRTHIL